MFFIGVDIGKNQHEATVRLYGWRIRADYCASLLSLVRAKK
jgi:hypothetical protein